MDLRLPPRDQDGHKGTFGAVSVIGGCCAGDVRMIGAPALAALGALRSGCGLVRVYAPAPILNTVLSIVPSATGRALKVDARGRMDPKAAAAAAREACAESDAVVIGPGMGAGPVAGPGVLACVRAAVKDARGTPLVLDADALNALASPAGRPLLNALPATAVLTPHPGEFARLGEALGLPSRARAGAGTPASEAARNLGALTASLKSPCTWVLKGRRTVVASSGQGHRNSTGNSALGTGGSGDVLAGVIAGLIAQFAPGEGRPHTLSLFRLACIGVRVHGLAGDLWTAARGAQAGLLAAELTEHLPQAIQRVRAR